MLFELAEPSQECEKLIDKYLRPNFEIMFKCFSICMPEGTPRETIQIRCLGTVAKCAFYLAHRQFINVMMGDNFIDDNRAAITSHIIEETIKSFD